MFVRQDENALKPVEALQHRQDALDDLRCNLGLIMSEDRGR